MARNFLNHSLKNKIFRHVLPLSDKINNNIFTVTPPFFPDGKDTDIKILYKIYEYVELKDSSDFMIDDWLKMARDIKVRTFYILFQLKFLYNISKQPLP